MRLAYISSIPCAPTSGGPLQIHRHFGERQDFEFFDFSDDVTPVWEQWLGKKLANHAFFKRTLNTRFHPYLLAAAYATKLDSSVKDLLPRVVAIRPDAIVTVAYGRQAFLAQKIAQKTGIPLVTFFHDWWPDLLYSLTPFTRRWLDKKIRALAQSSELLLSVCPELLEELAPHPNAKVLLPIPASSISLPKNNAVRARSNENGALLVYAGTLAGDYGAMIRELAYELIDNPNQKWQLKVYGRDDWSDTDRQRLAEAGIFCGFLNQGASLQAAFAEADAFLVVMDFEPKNRRRVRTSFPSKLLEYSLSGKPLVIWGPEECSAVRFIQEKNAGCGITESQPGEVCKSVERLFSDPDQCARFGQAAKQLAQTIFDPHIIHSAMKQHITALIQSKLDPLKSSEEK